MENGTGAPGAVHWAHTYIGVPWTPEGGAASSAGALPASFNCWTFVRHVQGAHFGRTLPEIPVAGDDVAGLARAFRDSPERGRWLRVDAPAEGDCVLLRQARYPIHVGVWIAADGGGVLHCIKGPGVVFQKPKDVVAHGWRIEGFYRFAGDPV